METYVFVGERRSATAIARGWTWETGHLAAKPLFRALDRHGVNPLQQQFINIFCDGEGREEISTDNLAMILSFIAQGSIVVGMGHKVHRALEEQAVVHIHIVHPAARGKIRASEKYDQHIKDKLGL